jgi:hypothetical protein
VLRPVEVEVDSESRPEVTVLRPVERESTFDVTVLKPVEVEVDSESRPEVTGRIQPVVATPLIEEVLHGTKCKAGV